MIGDIASRAAATGLQLYQNANAHHYQIVPTADGYFDRQYVDDSINPAVIVASHALASGTAFLSLHLRDKRQKLVFQKVIQKFPTAKSMYQFMKANNIDTSNFNPNMDQQDYGLWVAKNLVKNTRFWRAIVHFIFGLSPAGAVVNAVKLRNAKKKSADDIVRSRLS